MSSVRGKVAVVTGAGSGIGRQLALELAKRGARLALSDVDEVGLGETADRAGALGAEVHTARLDVSDRAAVEAYATAVAERFGVVHQVYNNAGVAGGGAVLDTDWAEYDRVLSINLFGVLHGTKAFLPHLIASGDGHLVNMSSLFGLVSIPSQSMYNSAKYAVRGFSEALREEILMAGHPVGVTVVHPGGIKTAIVRNARTSTREDHGRIARHFDEKLASMEPEEAARIIVVKGILGGKARLLVGRDAHVLHHFARLTGSRYQDIVAAVAKRTKPPKR
jgi:NADP-dependent 3-hydroxy acid dehydrogenase YdfG